MWRAVLFVTCLVAVQALAAEEPYSAWGGADRSGAPVE